MLNHWLRGLLLGVSMALLLAGGVAMAQDVGAGWDEPTMPDVPAGTYFTDSDNEDNALTGKPDDDMGLGLAEDPYICPEDPEGPVEFRIGSPGGAAKLIIAAWDVDEQNGSPFDEKVEVRFNGTYLGDLVTAPDETWAITVFPVTATGNDLVEAKMLPSNGELGCFGIAWGALDVEEEEFVPEPGSILLLGSGLAGLAGYATLRWRSRE